MKKHYFIVILIIVITIGSVFILDYKKTNMESDINGKEITNDEYLYKDDLLNIGYTIDDVKLISSNFNISIVKKFFLNKKYNNLNNYLNIPNFNIEHIDRYDNYKQNHPEYSLEDIVLYVEIGLDQDFYTNINEITNYKGITTLINKYNKLPDNYSFNDLVKLDKPYSSDGNKKVRKIVYDDLINMINNAKKDNVNLVVISAYRTSEYQDTLFNNSIKKNGVNHALLYSAKKNHSEHQLGLAVDFNNTNESFDQTKEYEWLKNNAYKYGFIKRYPKNKEFITGYGYEPWHYRYVGTNTATKIFSEKLTLEEYKIIYE